MEEILVTSDAWVIALALALAMLAAWGTGWWMRRRRRERGAAAPGTKFEDASIATLGLLLAFTFGTVYRKAR